MRLHANHHQHNPLTRCANISLDGRLVKNCVMADEERGQVLVHEFVEGGFIERRIRGTVRIIDSREWDIHRAYTRCDRG